MKRKALFQWYRELAESVKLDYIVFRAYIKTTAVPKILHIWLLQIFTFELCLIMLLFVQAMVARGFRGNPSNHKIYFLSESSFGIADLFSLLCLFAVVSLASFSDQLVWW